MNDEPIYDTAGAAAYLGVSLHQMRTYARRGRIARLRPEVNLFSQAALDAAAPTLRHAPGRPRRTPAPTTCPVCGNPIPPGSGSRGRPWRTCGDPACRNTRSVRGGRAGALSRWGARDPIRSDPDPAGSDPAHAAAPSPDPARS